MDEESPVVCDPTWYGEDCHPATPAPPPVVCDPTWYGEDCHPATPAPQPAPASPPDSHWADLYSH
jgi:hypothetical protein